MRPCLELAPTFLPHLLIAGLSYYGGAMVRRGDVEHAQLYPLRALPAVHRERPGYVQRLSTMRKQRISKFLSDRTKCHAIHDGAIAGFQAHTQMRLPYFL